MKKYAPISVDEIKESLKGDREQAQIRQIVTSVFPSGKVGTSLSDSLFDQDEFSFDEVEYDENRVTWIDVPTGTSKEEAEERIKKFPEACIYKVLSSKVILTTEQESAILAGLTSKAIIEARQKVVYGELDKEGNANPKAGQLITWGGKPQYRTMAFSKEHKSDIDLRPALTAAQKALDVEKKAEVVENTTTNADVEIN